MKANKFEGLHAEADAWLMACVELYGFIQGTPEVKQWMDCQTRKHDPENLTGPIANWSVSLPIFDDCIGRRVAGVIEWCGNARLNEKLGVVDGRLGFNLHVDHFPKIKLCRIGVHHCVVICRLEESKTVRQGTEAFLCDGGYVSPRIELHRNVVALLVTTGERDLHFVLSGNDAVRVIGWDDFVFENDVLFILL